MGTCGKNRRCTAAHNWLITKLSFLLLSQLDRSVYQTRTGSSRVRYLDATYVIPDLFAVPVALVAPLLRQDDVLEVYRDPLPLVVEVWSLFAGDFDIEEKLEIHKRRGDAEIWFIHPYEPNSDCLGAAAGRLVRGDVPQRGNPPAGRPARRESSISPHSSRAETGQSRRRA